MERLATDDIDRRIAELGGWRHEDERLRRSYQFADFVAAFGWMSSAALIAEKMNHHPDWKNVYNRTAGGGCQHTRYRVRCDTANCAGAVFEPDSFVGVKHKCS